MQHNSPTDAREDSAAIDRVALRAFKLEEPSVPSRVLIAPWGEVESASGAFLVDADAAKATINAFVEQATDLPIDYEHQTLGGAYSAPNGQAPAAGWIKSLAAVSPDEAVAADSPISPGLWANVEWTDDARAQLQSRQYRYLSPVALVRRSDRRLIGLHSVALTNKPAIVGMKPIVNSVAAAACSARPDAGDSIDSGDPICAGVAALRSLLDVDGTADDEVVLIAAAQKLQVLQLEQAARQAADRVARALSEGKLTPAQRDWALSLAQRNPAEFDAWMAGAPVLVRLGRTAPPAGHATLAGGALPCASRSRHDVEAAARFEWRAHREFLETLCTEDAYVANALRDAAS